MASKLVGRLPGVSKSARSGGGPAGRINISTGAGHPQAPRRPCPMRPADMIPEVSRRLPVFVGQGWRRQVTLP